MAHKTIRQREAAIDARLDGIGICHLDFGGGEAPAADPLVGQAAMYNAQTGKEFLDYTKEVDAKLQPARDEAIALALQTARAQAATAAKQEGYADDTYKYTKDTFRPIEEKIASDALGYDTEARRASESAQAMADTGSAIDAQRTNAGREIMSRGGDVNSPAYLAAMTRGSVLGGAAQGAAGNQAIKNVEAIGGAKLADAAALGRGISSTNATQTQLGLSAGNSSVGNAQVPGAIGAQQVGTMGAGVSGAVGANSSAGNLALGQYNATTNAQQAAGSSNNAAIGALGTMAGQAIFKFSDKDMKEDRKEVDSDISLDKIMRLPSNEEWRYKDDSPAADGGKKHTGHMAQDVQRVMGDEAAPGGKMVNLEVMASTGLDAIKDLGHRVISLENKVKPAKAGKKGAKHGK